MIFGDPYMKYHLVCVSAVNPSNCIVYLDYHKNHHVNVEQKSFSLSFLHQFFSSNINPLNRVETCYFLLLFVQSGVYTSMEDPRSFCSFSYRFLYQYLWSIIITPLIIHSGPYFFYKQFWNYWTIFSCTDSNICEFYWVLAVSI